MWQIILGIGVLFLIIEIFIPTMFFLNFAFAAFICAIVAYFYQSLTLLIILFCVLSLVLILTLRPIFLKSKNDEDSKTGMEEKYVGKTAKVVEAVSKDSGVVSIYDERWQARNIEDGIIEAGEKAEIVGYDNIILNVKKAL